MVDVTINVSGPATLILGPNAEEIQAAVEAATTTRLTALEATMSTASEAIAALTAAETAESAALADLIADVQALLVRLQTEPQLSAETQAAADALATKMAGDEASITAVDPDVEAADPPAVP